jgi:PST family polysaccharide transporter
VAIYCAWIGLGIWALVLGHLASHLTRTGLLWISSGWRPTRGGRLWSPELLRFGGTLTLINILDWSADGFLFLSVGKALGVRSLGVYRVSFEASRMSYYGLPALAGSVGLTGYASLLGDANELRRLMLKGLRIVNALAFPVAACIAALAPWIVPVVWGAKWLEAVPVLCVLALMGLAAPMANVVWPFYLSSGRLSALLKISVVRLSAYVVFISLAAGFGVLAVAAVHVALMLASTGFVVVFALRSVGGSAGELRDAVLWPALRAGACGLAAAAVASAVDFMPPLAVLLPATACGGLVYVASLYLTNREGFFELASVVGRGVGVIHRGS